MARKELSDPTTTPWIRPAAAGTALGDGITGAVAVFGTNITDYDVLGFPNGAGPVTVRKVGDEVQVRGSVKTISGVVPGPSSALITFASGWTPAGPIQYFPLAGTNPATAYLRTQGGTIWTSGTVASNWVPLDTVRFTTVA